MTEWDVLPAVTDMKDALSNRYVIHPDLGDNLCFTRSLDTGGVDAAFARADAVVETTFEFGRHTGVTLEPRAVLADWNAGEARLTIYQGTQAPHMVQNISAKHLGLEEAQVILVGVSRCGKTPTSIYLAMQFGIKAANYPLIPEDFDRGTLPAALLSHTNKIFGLTIKPERLHSVRTERRPDSKYASLENCRQEIITAENLMRNAGITWADSTDRSIEELSAIILQKIRIQNQ